jgi:hypothetical protein
MSFVNGFMWCGLVIAGIFAWKEIPFPRNLYCFAATILGAALTVVGVWRHRRKPSWERRIDPSGCSYLELVPVWRLRERLGKRLAYAVIGLGVIDLIVTALRQHALG